MTERRRKNPEELRRLLIAAAVALALKQGLAAVTVDAVARAAGVTKGGLFHHFPTKQALAEAVFAHLIAECDAGIDRLMADDPVAHGRFTRAYLALSLADDTQPDLLALWISASADPHLSRLFTAWVQSRLARHAATDSGPALEAVRFAADGLWFGAATGLHPADPAALRAHLLSLTRG